MKGGYSKKEHHCVRMYKKGENKKGCQNKRVKMFYVSTIIFMKLYLVIMLCCWENQCRSSREIFFIEEFSTNEVTPHFKVESIYTKLALERFSNRAKPRRTQKNRKCTTDGQMLMKFLNRPTNVIVYVNQALECQSCTLSPIRRISDLRRLPSPPILLLT